MWHASTLFHFRSVKFSYIEVMLLAPLLREREASESESIRICLRTEQNPAAQHRTEKL